MKNSIDLLAPAPTTASTRLVVVICGLLFTTLAAWAIIWPWTGDGDAVLHLLLAQKTFLHPSAAMTAFARPLHKFLLAVPAQGGNLCARLTIALVSTLCAWQTIRLAEDLQIRNSALAALMLIFQPYAFALSADTMTELPMALVTVIAIRLWLNHRPLASCLMASFLPLARPEGAFLLPVWGIMVLFSRNAGPLIKRLLYAATLAVGMICWALMCWLFLGDLLYLYHSWFWPANSASSIGHGKPLYYVTSWPVYCGPVLLVLFVAGAVAMLPRPVARWTQRGRSQSTLRFRDYLPPVTRRMALPLAVWLLVFSLHSFMWWRGMFGSLGLLRWIVPTAAITALICLIGFNAIAHVLARVGLGIRARGPIAIAALALCIIYAMAYYALSPSRYHGFALRRCANYIRENHLLAGASAIFRGDNIIVAELDLLYDPRVGEQYFDHDRQLAELLAMPKGAIGCWDDQQAEMWHCVEIDELEKLGFEVLYDDRRIGPNFWNWLYYGESRTVSQRYVVLRKETPAATPATQAATQPTVGGR